MAKWDHTVKIRHLLTEDEDLGSIRKIISGIGTILEKEDCFKNFPYLEAFKKEVPEGDGVINHLDYANKLIEKMYDYADSHRIWIE